MQETAAHAGPFTHSLVGLAAPSPLSCHSDENSLVMSPHVNAFTGHVSPSVACSLYHAIVKSKPRSKSKSSDHPNLRILLSSSKYRLSLYGRGSGTHTAASFKPYFSARFCATSAIVNSVFEPMLYTPPTAPFCSTVTIADAQSSTYLLRSPLLSVEITGKWSFLYMYNTHKKLLRVAPCPCRVIFSPASTCVKSSQI